LSPVLLGRPSSVDFGLLYMRQPFRQDRWIVSRREVEKGFGIILDDRRVL
jgi:hypothetical protein